MKFTHRKARQILLHALLVFLAVTVACNGAREQWACDPPGLDSAVAQPLQAVGFDVVASNPDKVTSELFVDGKSVRLLGDTSSKQWSTEQLVGPPWGIQVNGRMVAVTTEGAYFGTRLTSLHIDPTVLLAQLGTCRPDMARCDRSYLIIAFGRDSNQTQVVKMPDATVEQPEVLSKCSGELHIGLAGRVVSVSSRNDGDVLIRNRDSFGVQRSRTIAEDGDAKTSSGWPQSAHGRFVLTAGNAAVVFYDVDDDSIISTTILNPQLRNNGPSRKAVRCAAPLPQAKRWGELSITVDFVCSDPASRGAEAFLFNEKTNEWSYIAESGSERTAMSPFGKVSQLLPTWASANSDSESDDEPSARATPSCSLAAAESAVLARAKAQTNPYGELGRSTRFVSAGPCSWTVDGVIGWRDMISQQPIMYRFVAAVSGQNGRYDVDVFQITGGYPD